MGVVFPLDLLRADTQSIVKALDDGVITSVDLVKAYINQTKADNVNGKELRAVMQLAPEDLILSKAKELDDSRQTGRKGLLHGIPVLVKDSIGTGPEIGLNTTAGSPSLLLSPPKASSPVAQGLIDSGMIIIGKTNLTVLNTWMQFGLPHGWSPLGGQVRSPYRLGAEPGGSSAGSAVAIAAGFAPVSLGTDTCGSITYPSQLAGVYSVKPTVGSIDTTGVVPISHRFDGVGPIGKSVYGIAAMLDIMLLRSGRSLVEVISDDTGLTIAIGKDLGIVTNPWLVFTEEDRKLYDEVVGLLSDSILKEDIKVEGHRKLAEAGYHGSSIGNVCDADFKHDFDKYLSGVDGPIRTLNDLAQWQEAHPDVAFHPSTPGQSHFTAGLNYGPERSEELAESLAFLHKVSLNVQEIFDKGIDVLIWPLAGASYFLFTAGGFPAANVPYMVREDGTPFGITLLAKRNDEETLLRAMAMCERRFPPRPAPTDY